jgi:hypothetical protein
MGEASNAPGAVDDLGTSEEDGPVTWETLVSPREMLNLGGWYHFARAVGTGPAMPLDGGRLYVPLLAEVIV